MNILEREMENFKKIKFLGMRNKIHEIKTTPNEIKNRISFTEEKVSELINRAM